MRTGLYATLIFLIFPAQVQAHTHHTHTRHCHRAGYVEICSSPIPPAGAGPSPIAPTVAVPAPAPEIEVQIEVEAPPTAEEIEHEIIEEEEGREIPVCTPEIEAEPQSECVEP